MNLALRAPWAREAARAPPAPEEEWGPLASGKRERKAGIRRLPLFVTHHPFTVHFMRSHLFGVCVCVCVCVCVHPFSFPTLVSTGLPGLLGSHGPAGIPGLSGPKGKVKGHCGLEALQDNTRQG